MTKLTIELSHDWQEFIASRITLARVRSVEDAIDAALVLFKADELKYDRLVEALEEGSASGDAGPLEMESLIEEAKRRYRRAA